MAHSTLKLSAAAIALVAAGPALADISARDVWESWQSASGGLGQSLAAGTETYSDGVLTLEDVTADIDMPEGTAASSIDRIVMTEQGDGTVLITIEGAYSVTLDMMPAEGDPARMTLSADMPGLEMVASGTPEDTTYDYSADAVALTLESLEVAGQPQDGTFELAMTEVAGTYRLARGETMEIESDVEAAGLTFALDMTDPETPGSRVNVTADYTGFATTSAVTVEGEADFADPDALLTGAIVIAADYSHDGGGYTLSGTGPDGAFSFASSSDEGSMSFAVDGTGVAVDFANLGVDLSMSGDTIPFPEVTFGADEVSGAFAMPLQQADAPSDLVLQLTLGGLTVSDMIWSMFDPNAALPRDPATLALDVTGLMRLTADITDEAAMNAPVPPVDFETLDLNNLTVSFAGAELTGSGGFDFSQAPEGAMPGMPGVSGQVSLKLVGANALLDTLVGMGLLPEEQAMGARMMMGMLARPTGDDILESDIELGADGSISANGQRLQ